MQLGLACVILVAIHPIIQWRPQVGHFQIAKPVPHDTLDWHAPANYKAHCRFAIYPRQPPRCNFLSFITTAANCAMLETLAPFAANGRPLSTYTRHLLLGCWAQTPNATTNSASDVAKSLSSMNVNWSSNAGKWMTIPLARSANLAGFPPVIRQVEATTTGTPKPMI